MERSTRLAVLDLRAELIYDPLVIAVERAVDHDERVCVRLPEQILRLVDLVGGVHGHEHGADLRRGPECQALDILEKYEIRKFKGLEIQNDDPEFNEIKKAKKGKRGIPIKYESIE